MRRLGGWRSGGDPPVVRVLVPGEAEGELLFLEEPLSFWGGLDPATGLIIDAHHPQHGVPVTGRILSLPGGRGSSSSSTVLAEALRLGTGPAGLILERVDPILVTGALVAARIYGTMCPVVVAALPPSSSGRWRIRGGMLTEIGDV